MSGPQLTRAKLIPIKGTRPDPDTSTHLEVQFNPSSLKVSLSNSLKADTKGGGGAAAQFVEKSESSLTVELVYDTSVARPGVAAFTDVRIQTARIAEAFMKPGGTDPKKPKAPPKCCFRWGRFQFIGMISAYGETLDFFAPEGIPLRATLALTLKEDRYQYELLEGEAVVREDPWRLEADASGVENPRALAAKHKQV